MKKQTRKQTVPSRNGVPQDVPKKIDRGLERRHQIIKEHGDGVVLWKQLALPEGDWVVCITEQGDPLAGRFWTAGAPVLGDSSLRFLGVQRGALCGICEAHGSTSVATGLSATPPDGYVLLAVFVGGGTTLAFHPELDFAMVAVADEEA